MVLLATESPSELVTFLTAISKITDEIVLRVKEGGLAFRGMDTAHISMIDMLLPRSYFSVYELDEGEEVLSVMADKVVKFLKSVKKNERLEISKDKERGRMVMKAVSGYIREFAVPLLSLEESPELGLPKVELPVTYKITCSILVEALKNIKQVSDRVKLLATQDELQIRGESDEGYETAVSLKYGSVEVIDREVRDESKLPASSTYNIDLLEGVSKELKKVADVVSVSFGSALPLKLSFEISGDLKFDFYLAPRVGE